jgi:1-acyl-sn-glycerol-3-phosphate acyltransferase
MEKEQNVPRLERTLAKPIWEFNRTLRFKKENEEAFLNALSCLKTNSLLIYFNHFALLDPALVLKSLNEHDLLSKTAVLVSRKHLDKDRGIVHHFESFVMNSASLEKGFTLLPVVQVYDRDFYPDHASFNRQSLIKAVRHLREEGNILLMAPEGTRSKTGGLIKPEEGVGELLRLASQTALAYPVAMEHGKILPFVTDTQVIYGKSPFTYQEANAKASARKTDVGTIMMQELADLLPSKNKGIY